MFAYMALSRAAHAIIVVLLGSTVAPATSLVLNGLLGANGVELMTIDSAWPLVSAGEGFANPTVTDATAARSAAAAESGFRMATNPLLRSGLTAFHTHHICHSSHTGIAQSHW